MIKEYEPTIRNRKAYISFCISILSLAYSILIIRSFWTSLSIFDADNLMIILLFILSMISVGTGYFSIRKIKSTAKPIKGKCFSVFGIIFGLLSVILLLLPGFVFFVNSIIHPPNYNVVLQLRGPSDRIIQSLLEQTKHVISSRIRYYAEPYKIRIIPPDKLIITLRIPGKFKPENLDKLFKTNQLSFNLVHQENEDLVSHSTDPNFITPHGYKIFNDGAQDFFVQTKPELIGNIDDAEVGFDTFSRPYILIKLKPEGRDLFFRITQKNINRRLAIMVDDKVYSAPMIKEPIKGGALNLTGDFTIKEAADLAFILKSGSIPLPVRIIKESLN